jgi:large subunit ribosomal protein L24e
MAKCSFCGSELLRGTGLMYVKNDGKQFYFCGRKCEKALIKYGRESRKYKWTAAYQRGGIKAHAGGAKAAQKPAAAAKPAVPATAPKAPAPAKK